MVLSGGAWREVLLKDHEEGLHVRVYSDVPICKYIHIRNQQPNRAF